MVILRKLMLLLGLAVLASCSSLLPFFVLCIGQWMLWRWVWGFLSEGSHPCQAMGRLFFSVKRSPRVCGRMRWGILKKSRREREGSRATPLCQCCCLLESTQLWRPIRRRLLDDEKLLVYLDDVTVVQCLQSWQRNSHDTHTSASTTGRPKCGTVVESHLTA